MNFWLVVTSPANFKLDRETLHFKTQGLPPRCRKTVQKMTKGDKVAYYIMGLQRFGATVTITGEYYEDKTKLWTDDDESWPCRCPSEPDLVLMDDELIDAKKLVPNLSFIERKDVWGVYLQGSVRQIPEEDFRLIESEMRKVISDRQVLSKPIPKMESHPKTEKEYEKAIMLLPLQSTTLHDRLGEMLEQVGSWLDYNTQTRYRITPDHAYQLDVAWLRGKNPEIAIEIQISGNLTEAKDRLAQARKFNYRKVIVVIREHEMDRLNTLMRHEHELRCWMEAWSVGAILEMYTAGQKFNDYYKKLTESVYKDKNSLQMIE